MGHAFGEHWTQEKILQSVKDCMNKNGRFIKRCKSQKDASKETGVSVSQISCCAKGQKKSCKGYEFQRIEEFPMAVTKRRFGEE